MNLNDCIITKDASLRDAMHKINKFGQTLLIVVDNMFHPIAVLSDGDIRRFLVLNGNINSNVMLAANSSFVYATLESTRDELLKLVSADVKYIPLVNSDNCLVGVFGSEIDEFIPVYTCSFSGNESRYLNESLQSSFISSTGQFISKFEDSFSLFTGLESCLSVSNGTAALDLAFQSAGLTSSDHVLVPSLTFASPVNAAIRTGADIELYDISHHSLVPSVSNIQSLIRPNTKLIVFVHLYGYPVDIPSFRKVLPPHVLIIEDCAEAFGSYYSSLHCGSQADFATFSFFGNKTITTGEGGMLYVRDQILRSKCKQPRDHGMRPSKRYWHDYVGFNFRLTNLQASIGVAQLEQAHHILDSKRRIFLLYKEILEPYGFCFYDPAAPSVSSHWLVAVSSPLIRKIGVSLVESRLRHLGIDTRKFFYPLHTMPIYSSFASSLPNSLDLYKSSLCLPSFPSLTNNQVYLVCSKLMIVLGLQGE